MKPKPDQLQELAEQTPDLPELDADYRLCLDRRGTFDRRQRLNRESQFCVWPGQSDDGRKWTPRGDDESVRPWKGASDARPHVVDTFVKEDVAKLMVIRARGKITVTGTESNDAEFSTRLTQLLCWQQTQMKQLWRETELAAQWMRGRGTVAVGCYWDRQSGLGYETVDFETFQTRAMMAYQALNAGHVPEGWDARALVEQVRFPELLLDPAQEAEACRILQSFYPDARKPDILGAVRDLRQNGYARFVRPYIRVNRPCVVARAIGEEVFLPEEATDFESTRAVHERLLLTESALRERAAVGAWDSKFVDEVVETQRGNVLSGLNRAAQMRWSANTGGLSSIRLDKMFEVIASYRRLADDRGVQGVYYTIWHSGMVNKSGRRQRGYTYGYHGLLNYDHGEMPYTLFPNETRSRLVDDARGTGEVAGTGQAAVKAVWDNNIDAASISTVPPWHYPPDEPPEAWGPGVGIPTSRPDKYGFFEGVRPTPLSEKVEAMVMRHLDRYYGRRLPDGSNVIESDSITQYGADKWLRNWAQVDTQMLQLMQQFLPDTIYYRVVGDEQARPLHTTRDEIQGAFDVQISFNTGLLDQERVKQIFGFVEQALQWGSGRIDVDEMVAFGFELLDPNLAGRVLKPSQQAAADEVDDERDVLTASLAGIPTDIRPGQAYAIRLQWLQQELGRNQTAQQRYQQDPAVKDAIENRLKQLNHQVEQQTVNPVAGRLGGLPAAARQ